MKATVLGALAGAGLAMLAVASWDHGSELFAQRPATHQAGIAGSELIVLPLAGGERHQLLAIVDPRQRVLSVYQVDPANGKITLLSVRNIQWDMQMTDFNTGNPLPREIRTLLEQR